MNRYVIPGAISSPFHVLKKSEVEEFAPVRPLWVLLFFLLHVPLGLLMFRVQQIATIHALVTIGLGLIWALSGHQIERVVYIAAYITGAEVLWRMTGAHIFWEVGKYAVVIIFLLALLRNKKAQPPLLPFLYFILLLPSAVFTLNALPLNGARQQISFNLSGPLSLMVSVWFFSKVPFNRSQLQRLLLFLVAPVVAVFAIALFNTFTAEAITFRDESNILTSGGYGPNQVSGILSAGVLLLYLYLSDARGSKGFKFILFGLLLAFVTQSMLTFSRSGLYFAAGSILIASMFLARNRMTRTRILFITVASFLVAWYVLLPRLEAFTQGQLLVRFADTSSTGRDLIIQADMQIWRQHLLFGVGPGQATPLHAILFRSTAAHTEFSRMLSEHGLLGLLSMLILLILAIKSFSQAKGIQNRGFVTALIVWSLLYMLTNAMRTVAPGLLFGLAMNPIFSQETVVHRRDSRPQLFSIGTNRA